MDEVFNMGGVSPSRKGKHGKASKNGRKPFSESPKPSTSLAQTALMSFPEERSEEDLDLIYQYLVHLPPACRRFFNLRASRSNLRYLCKHLKLLTPSRNTLIYKQGEVGDKFYVIVEGVCEVLHAPVCMTQAGSLGRLGETGGAGVHVTGPEERRQLGCRVGVLPAGECFGENSIGQERDSSVICNGSTVQGKPFPAQILQVDGKAYRRCIRLMFQSVEAVLRRRCTRLKQLFVFSGWPDAEYNFFSYWMKDVTYEPGTTIYNIGDPVSYVYFLSAGSVTLSVDTDRRPGQDFVVELVKTPSYFGELEVIDREETRMHKVAVPAGGPPAVMAAIPVNVFWRLLLSEMAARSYETANRLEKLAAARRSWHQLRLDDLEESGDVHHSLLHEIQSRFLGCPLCGEMNHMPEDCQLGDETKLPPAEGAVDASEPEAGSKPGTPASGANASVSGSVGKGSSAGVVARRKLGLSSPRSGAGTPRSRGSRASRAGSPAASPRSSHTRLTGTPRSDAGSEDGDDWNGSGKRGEEGGPRLDPAAKLFLQEAKADIRSVMKAVVKFKQLVARRRAERAAAAAAAGGTGADVAGSGAGRGNGQPSRGHSQKGGFANKSGAMPPSSVHIAPLSFSVKAEDIISGSLPRPSNPRAVRKSKSVSDISPIPVQGRRRLKKSLSMGVDVSQRPILLSPQARRLRQSSSEDSMPAISPSGAGKVRRRFKSIDDITIPALAPGASFRRKQTTGPSPKAATGSLAMARG